MILPGESARIKISMIKNMPVFEGQRFTLRENKITVASGIITKLKDPIPVLPGAKLVKIKISDD